VLTQTLIEIDGEQCRCSRGVAAILGIGRNQMLQELREHGVFTHDNLPTSAQYVYDGYFKLHKSDGWDKITTYYTSEGIDFVKDICKNLPRKPVKKERPYKEKYDYELASVIEMFD
jgi:hypothetical protein